MLNPFENECVLWTSRDGLLFAVDKSDSLNYCINTQDNGNFTKVPTTDASRRHPHLCYIGTLTHLPSLLSVVFSCLLSAALVPGCGTGTMRME